MQNQHSRGPPLVPSRLARVAAELWSPVDGWRLNLSAVRRTGATRSSGGPLAVGHESVPMFTPGLRLTQERCLTKAPLPKLRHCQQPRTYLSLQILGACTIASTWAYKKWILWIKWIKAPQTLIAQPQVCTFFLRQRPSSDGTSENFLTRAIAAVSRRP